MLIRALHPEELLAESYSTLSPLGPALLSTSASAPQGGRGGSG